MKGHQGKDKTMKEYGFYKTGSCILLIWSFILLAGIYNVDAITKNCALAKEAYLDESDMTSRDVFGMLDNSASRQRVVSVSYVERNYVIDITKEDHENLLRIVEAEAGGEDRKGKILVANVILNRVRAEQFPDTVTEVIFQKEDGVCQFSPIRDGRFYSVEVSADTKEAVEAALYGEDCSSGALFFMARAYADKEKAAWFDRNLTKLFSYGGHEFFSL